MEVGEARERVGILSLTETDEGFCWAEEMTIWAKVEETGARNLFSSVGLAAGTVEIAIRKRALSLQQMMEWKGQKLFLTSIQPREKDPGWLTVMAAKVVVETVVRRECTGVSRLSFPCVRTELYAKHRQDNPMSVNELRQALVTPKTVALRPGQLVVVGGVPWEVLVPYELDPYKNEYEISRQVEL